MNAGILNRKITFQTETFTTNATLEKVGTWSNTANVWAHVLVMTGHENIETARDTATRITKFKIRWRNDINESMRIVYNSRNYDITIIKEIGYREGLEIMAINKF